MTDIEKMAQQMFKQFREKFNYVPPCDYENATLDGLPFLEIAQCLLELGYRPEAEVRADTVKEFVEKLLSPLIKAYNQSYKASGYDMESARSASEIKHYIDHIKQTVEQFGKEEL